MSVLEISSIHAITKMPAHFLLTFLIIAHTFSVVQRVCVCVRARVSPPRRTRVASAWHPRCTHRGHARLSFFALLREKKRVFRESRSRATLILSRDDATRGSRKKRKRWRGRRREGRWRTGIATEARPGVHPLALPRPAAAGVPPGHHDDRDVHTRR